jgi:hypothetical protein
MPFMQKISLAFSAGALGGLVNGLALWLTGWLGIPRLLGVALAPALTPAFLYNRLVWGGLFGILLVLAARPFYWVGRGLFVSLAPTLVQLFIVFPHHLGKGYGGLDLGTLTPAFVLVFNAIWGLTAAWWYDAATAAKGGGRAA